MTNSLSEQFRRGDRRALAQWLTAAARGQDVEALLSQIKLREKPSRVVAITGGAGVGKSTLIGRLIDGIRRDGLKVAVLACDPKSPFTGGALLGDRFRMPAKPDDDGLFIRSLAAEPGHGAVAPNLPAMVRLLEAFGFDIVLIETVGAGQGDTAVRATADTVVLLLQPETGDDLQWEKAGLLEVADIVVIQKSDLPGAERMDAQVRETLGLSPSRPISVLRASAKSGEGIEQLWRTIANRPTSKPIS
jgi:LAO/AO transport system ATPase